MSAQPLWIASWIATGLVLGQLVLIFVLGAGEVGWVRYAGFGLGTLAAVFGQVPLHQFRKHGGVAPGNSSIKTTRLVDSGLYAIVRHPQFVAWPLMSVAFALVSQDPVVVALGALAIVLFCFDYRPMEALDIAKFGDEYRDYMDRVPGWNFVAGFWRWVQRRTPARS